MINLANPCIVTASILAFSAGVATACDFSNYVGWTIIYSGTVTGYVDENDEEQDSFEGCEYDRVLIIDYSKAVTCAEYSYSYAYHPEVLIISRDGSMKACIDNDMYDVRK